MLMDRVIGVFKLNVATFEEIEHDRSATSQAAIVVAVVALLSALGSGIFNAGGRGFFAAFLGTLIWTFVGWLIWSAVTYFVGTSLFGGQATLDEMMRVLGFAYAPQVLGVIPCIGALIGAIWSLVAGFIAVRQGLDLDDLKAFFTILIGFAIYLIGSFLLNLLLGGLGAMLPFGS